MFYLQKHIEHESHFVPALGEGKMHVKTLARHSEDMKTPEDERKVHEEWEFQQQTSQGKRRKKSGPLMPCPACEKAMAAQ